MTLRTKSISASRMVEDVVGCKWSLAVLGMVRRPGAMEHAIPGLSKKIRKCRRAWSTASRRSASASQD